MRKFILNVASEKVKKMDNDILGEKAHQTFKRIKSGEEKTSLWKTVKKRLLK